VGHPPRIPAWLRWEQSVIYFVTICVKDRKRVLANDAAFNAFKNAAAKLREWRVLAAILMPDHLHIVVAPRERDARLGNFSAALKRWMRKELDASWEWQLGCFDRLLRSDESLHEKWLYLQENPVRAGLVSNWRDWPYRFEFNEQKEL
jgi:REP element-mobilizing transposase RayT